MKHRETEEQKRLFICWAFGDTRSESLSHCLGAECYYTRTYFRVAFPLIRYLFALPKYLVQGVETFLVLLRKRPDVIFVQNPPIFAALVVWFYCLFTSANFVTDTHTGAFDRWHWKQFLWLYHFVGKRAVTNILHNEPLSRRVTEWDLPAISIGDFPFHLTSDRVYPFRKGFNVVVVCSFATDEPIFEIIKAAACLPNVNFYLSGNLKGVPKQIFEKKTPNVILTDYIPLNDYVALLKGSDIVVVLTTNNDTMQNGALEALELERPIITSDWPVLREAFYKGTIYIDNTAASLVRAIEQMRNNYSYYLTEVKILREELHAGWGEKFANLLSIIEN